MGMIEGENTDMGQLLIPTVVVVNVTIKVVNTNFMLQIIIKDGQYFREESILFLSCGGSFVHGGGKKSEYIGGMVRTRCIKEGTTYEELQRIISSLMGKESNEICVKFKVSMDTSTFVDLVDDERVEHLIRYNEEYDHVYIEEYGNNDSRLPRMNVEMEEQEM